MTQQPQQPQYQQQAPQTNVHVHTQPTQSNALGLIGFILSLVSLFLCLGSLSPLALLLSLIGLFKAPRGLAIAGLIISLIGSIITLIFWVVFGAATLALFGLGMALVDATYKADMDKKANGAYVYYQENDALPTEEELLLQLVTPSLKDMNDNDMTYKVTGETTFTLTGAGLDGTMGTDDDITKDYDIKLMEAEDKWGDKFNPNVRFDENGNIIIDDGSGEEGRTLEINPSDLKPEDGN